MSDLGYVVIEWNHASGQPEIADVFPHDTREGAQGVVHHLRARTARTGRRERFTIARLEDVDDG